MCEIMEEMEREILEKAAKETAEAIQTEREKFGSMIIADFKKNGMTTEQLRERLVRCYKFSSEEAEMLIKKYY